MINFIERITNFVFRKLGVKLRLSEVLRIILVKVIQSENSKEKLITTKEFKSEHASLPRAFDISIKSRDDFVSTISNFKGKRLEIGPYMYPLLNKDSNTYFSDYFSTDELKQEAVKDNRYPSKVAIIDFPTK